MTTFRIGLNHRLSQKKAYTCAHADSWPVSTCLSSRKQYVVMSDRIWIRIRAFFVIEISPNPPSTPAASNGGTSSTPVTAPVDSPAPRQPPPGYDPELARQLDILTNGYGQIYGVDPSESRN